MNMNMDIMNDDCWCEIFKQLALVDQLTILQVSKHFKGIMQVELQRKYRELNVNMIQCPLTGAQFNRLLESICCTVQVIRVKFISRAHVRALQQHSFHNVHDLRFSQLKKTSMVDDDIAILSQRFPNLRTFSPHGQFSGVHFTKFLHLEQLTLSYCSKICPLQLRQILLLLPLRTIHLNIDVDISKIDFTASRLQRITVSGGELLDLLLGEKIQNFPNIKTIVITERDEQKQVQFLRYLPQFKRDTIISLEIYQQDKHAVMNALETYPQLRKLTLASYCVFNELCYWHDKLPLLKEIIVCYCTRIRIEDILSVLNYYTELELLSFLHCSLNDKPHEMWNITNVLGKRTKRLILNWYPFSEVNGFLTTTDDAKLEICSIPGDIISYEPLTIEFS